MLPRDLEEAHGQWAAADRAQGDGTPGDTRRGPRDRGGDPPVGGRGRVGRRSAPSTTDPALGEKQDYDARQGTSATSKGAISRRAAKASSRTATQQLRSSLGDQAIVEMDGTTGTVRVVARLNGFLTAGSRRPAPTVVMDYVSAHLAALGLTRNDLATFNLRRDYVDIIGTHHLSWTQSVDGDPVFGNGLQANVNKHGRILSLGGSPISGLFTPKRGTQRVATRNAAIAKARADVSEPTKAGPRDTAKRVVFVGPGGPRAAWQVVTMSSQRPTLSVVDARTGAVVFRKSLRDDARGDRRHRADPDRRRGGRDHLERAGLPVLPEARARAAPRCG